MQALTYVARNSLEWRELPEPELQTPGEALVRPLAVSACDLDFGIIAGRTPFEPPFVLGHEFAGEVVAVGDQVTDFHSGDLVAVSFQPSCGACGHCHRGHTAACGSVPRTSMYGVGAIGGDWGGALSDLVRVPYAHAMLARLPAGVSPAMAAGASDNIADGYRTVAPGLAAAPGAAVLVAGDGSIALYAAWWAKMLGAAGVTLCSRDAELLRRAERHGIAVEAVSAWPRRFSTHAITVDCTGDEAGLTALIRSTEAFGVCTSASMYFGGPVALPLLEMYMKGIRFETGRVNGAAVLPVVLELIAAHGLTPSEIEATVVPWQGMADALLERCFKPIAVRD